MVFFVWPEGQCLPEHGGAFWAPMPKHHCLLSALVAAEVKHRSTEPIYFLVTKPNLLNPRDKIHYD